MRLIELKRLQLRMDELHTKLEFLRERIRKIKSCAVAFSGGVDSTFVLQVAQETLGARVIGVTALSESLPSGELEEAQHLALRIGARHVVLRTFETRDETYLRKLGVGQVRVRHHGRLARIEVEPKDFSLVRLKEAEINAHLNTLGFAEVVLDPAGYHSGNPNSPIAEV